MTKTLVKAPFKADHVGSFYEQLPLKKQEKRMQMVQLIKPI